MFVNVTSNPLSIKVKSAIGVGSTSISNTKVSPAHKISLNSTTLIWYVPGVLNCNCKFCSCILEDTKPILALS